MIDFLENLLGIEVFKVCSFLFIYMKVQFLNQMVLQVFWSQLEIIYYLFIMNYMIFYSWIKNEDEKEKIFIKDSDKDLKVIISYVLFDSFYLF